MKTPSEITRNNARILLRQVRGKTKEERQAMYSALRAGPFFWLIASAFPMTRALMIGEKFPKA